MSVAKASDPVIYVSATKAIQRGCSLDAIQVLEAANQAEAPLSSRLYPCLLQWCIDRKLIRLGRELHCSIVKRKMERNPILANYLVRMYAAGGILQEADKAFMSVRNPDIYMWTAIILAHANACQSLKAVEFYGQMLQCQGLRPDAHLFVAVLKACAITAALNEGKMVHGNVIESNLELALHVGNILIDMYVRCGCLDDAQCVFNKMTKRDVVTWNALLSGYVGNKHSEKAFELCQTMQQADIAPDSVTLLNLVGSFRGCTENHECEMIPQKMDYASKIFKMLPNKSLASWSAMIAMHAEFGDQEKAFCLYLELLKQTFKPDIVTFVCVLKACSDLEMVNFVHFHIIESGSKLDLQILNCLIDVYGRGGSLEDARTLFDSLRSRCVVTWSSMISACAQCGRDWQSLELFHRMLEEGFKPNEVTYLCAMRSCANMAALILSLLVYAHAIYNGWDCHMQVKNTAIDMFGKCGSIADACSVFQGMQKRSVVTWSAMISAYAQHGEHDLSLECFNGMVQEGIKPNSVTYVCLLAACFSFGVVSHVNNHLHAMQKIYDINLAPEHRNCIVELYGRAGQLKEAADLLQGSPDEFDSIPWISLLNQCKSHGHVNIAKHCFNSINVM